MDSISLALVHQSTLEFNCQGSHRFEESIIP